MKEELLRALKVKLDDIEGSIASLTEINAKIDNENNKLKYANEMLELFKTGDEFDVLNFAKLSKDNFTKILEIVENNSDKVFNTDSCNYEGLVYLINGINNGVLLSLNEEQKSSVEYLIKGLSDKKDEYSAVIDGLELVKSRFSICDLNVLEEEKNRYSIILDGINKNNYISDTTKIIEAMNFSNVNIDGKIGILSYILEYNANVYENKGKVVETPIVETPVSEEKETNFDNFVFQPLGSDSIQTFNYPGDNDVIDASSEIEYSNDDKENTTSENNNEPQETSFSELVFEEPTSDKVESNGEEINVSNNDDIQEYTPNVDVEKTETNEEVDHDFADIVESDDDYEEYNVSDEEEKVEKTSSRELQRLFNEYGVKDIEIKEELLNGDVNQYRTILDILKKNDILNDFKKNSDLLYETVLFSGEDEINNVLKIVGDNLSVDDEDYQLVIKIVISTIPAIFIRDGGCYDNFIKNIAFFRELGINLIDLFNFSKEVFLVDNEVIVNNYEIVKAYNVDLTYRNVKYLLVLDDIAERMDYYVESVYEDKTRHGETFDGIKFINDYAVKLNSVCDLTIKRLRFASENGSKVFGSKPNSLTGEITNLKVNALEISDSYLNGFFDNEFDGLSGEEVKEFAKLIRNSSNVGNYADELEILSTYRNGLRYVINGINVSYNKVVRNYNILRSYGINSQKALHFAICYNLVITKEEYQKLKEFIEKIGGNA